MGVQIIKTESGDELIVLSRRDYDALLARSGDEAAEDRMTLVIAAEARAERPLPQRVSENVLKGMSILSALRQEKAWTQGELATRAGITQSYLSQLEGRAKTGTAETLEKLAKALEVPLAWLE